MRRLILCLTLGIGCGVGAWYSIRLLTRLGASPSDFAQIWYAARAFRNGLNPYDIVGPGREFEWGFPLLYPLPAVIVGVPFSYLPLPWAEAVFVGVGCTALAYSVTRKRWTPTLCVFASVAMLRVATTAQWSPLITAAGLLPWLGWVLAAKPSIGLAMLVAYPSLGGIVGATLFLGITLAVWPWWLPEWVAALPSATHMAAPIVGWGGPLLALALFRWRRPEARLLFALACIPHTPVLYEAVPLFLVVSTWEEGIILAALTAIWQTTLSSFAPFPSYAVWMWTGAQLEIAFLYLPCLLMVWRRPNAGVLWLPQPGVSAATLWR